MKHVTIFMFAVMFVFSPITVSAESTTGSNHSELSHAELLLQIKSLMTQLINLLNEQDSSPAVITRQEVVIIERVTDEESDAINERREEILDEVYDVVDDWSFSRHRGTLAGSGNKLYKSECWDEGNYVTNLVIEYNELSPGHEHILSGLDCNDRDQIDEYLEFVDDLRDNL